MKSMGTQEIHGCPRKSLAPRLSMGTHGNKSVPMESMFGHTLALTQAHTHTHTLCCIVLLLDVGLGGCVVVGGVVVAGGVVVNVVVVQLQQHKQSQQ